MFMTVPTIASSRVPRVATRIPVSNKNNILYLSLFLWENMMKLRVLVVDFGNLKIVKSPP